MFDINLALPEIKVRPNADHGVWLMFLLPVALIVSTIKHLQESSQIFCYNACLSIGLIGTSIIFIIQCRRKQTLAINRTLHLIPATLTATFLRFFFNTGLVFSLVSGIVSSIFYWKILIVIFQKFPYSFSLGELFIVAQALTLFLYSTIINLFISIVRRPTKVLDISTVTIQIGLCAIGLIVLLTHHLKSLRKPLAFYAVSIAVLVLFIVILLHGILHQSPLVWIFAYLFEDISKTKIVLYWLACTIAAIMAINRQIQVAKKATPAIRKIFHVFAVVVFLPGFIYQCSLIYLSSGVILGMFIALEMLRVLNIPPLAVFLQQGFVMYKDEKDTGSVALTPIYLLVGCALPLWIHPASCDILDSAGFNLVPVMSGVLSIGIGDTVASIIGLHFGKHYWPGTKKTMEGTMACILSQIAVVYALIFLGFVTAKEFELMKIMVSIIIASLVEASTTQIDNIVLPLISFIILC